MAGTALPIGARGPLSVDSTMHADRTHDDHRLHRTFVDMHHDLLALAVLRLRAGHDVLVAGGAGSGRSRVLREVMTRLGSDAALVSLPGLDRIPLDGARQTVLARAANADSTLGPGVRAPSVLSTSLPHPRAVRHCRQHFVAAGRPEPTLLTLCDLGAAGVQQLAQVALGARLTDPAAAAVMEATGGRHVDVEAALLQSQAKGQLTREGRKWAFRAEPFVHVDDSALDDILATVAPGDRDTVVRIALMGVGSLDAFHAVCASDTIRRLQDGGQLQPLVDPYDPDLDGGAYGLARPVYSAAMVRRLSPAQRARHIVFLLDALPRANLNRTVQRRYAQWALEYNRGAPRLVHDESWFAYRRGDLAFVDACASQLSQTPLRREALILRGAAHARRGNLAAAGRDFASAAQHVGGPDTESDAAGLAALAAAVARPVTLERRAPAEVSAERRVAADAAEAGSAAHDGLAFALAGNVHAAQDALARFRVGPVPDVAREFAAAAHALLAVAEVDARQLGRARQLWHRARDDSVARVVPVVHHAIEAHEVELAVVSGDPVAAAQRRARHGLARARESLDRYALVTWGVAQATADLAAGDIAAALDITDEVLGIARATGQRAPVPLLLAQQAWAHINGGAFEAAMAALDQLAGEEPDGQRAGLCAGAVAALSSPGRAGDIMHAMANNARDYGNVAMALEACAIALRVGETGPALDACVDEVHVRVATPRTAVMAAHAAALRRRDPDALNHVSRRYVRMGRRLSAADASLQAFQWSGEVRYTRRATALLDTCPQAWSPLAPAHAQTPLRPREHDVATGAALGQTNAAIAAKLSLSTRSVETYLTAVYRKLGVRNRGELTTFHAPMFARAESLRP